MRTIKFRAWIPEERRMFFPSSISWKNGLMWCGDVHGDSKVEMSVENSEVMQFTGFCDKNGKEIYEGDIVREYDWCNKSYSESREIHFHSGAFLACDIHDNGSCSIQYHLSHAFDGYEVIGNIYETERTTLK